MNPCCFYYYQFMPLPRRKHQKITPSDTEWTSSMHGTIYYIYSNPCDTYMVNRSQSKLWFSVHLCLLIYNSLSFESLSTKGVTYPRIILICAMTTSYISLFASKKRDRTWPVPRITEMQEKAESATVVHGDCGWNGVGGRWNNWYGRKKHPR
jgi:hypothetical protein